MTAGIVRRPNSYDSLVIRKIGCPGQRLRVVAMEFALISRTKLTVRGFRAEPLRRGYWTVRRPQVTQDEQCDYQLLPPLYFK